MLGRSALPDGLWAEAAEALPFVQELDDAELARLRDLVVLFLDTKSIVGAGGHEVTPLQRVVIAIQACVLVLELSLDWYADFENVVVYPDEFVPGWTWEDEAGVVHANDGPLAGEAMPGGPVALSWPDVEASADFEATGMNLVIHEFAHKIDMRDGDANGCPPLDPPLDARNWKAVMSAAYDDFAARVDRDEETAIDPLRGGQPRRVLRGAVGGLLRVPGDGSCANIRTSTGSSRRSTARILPPVRRSPAARARSAGASRRGPAAGQRFEPADVPLEQSHELRGGGSVQRLRVRADVGLGRPCSVRGRDPEERACGRVRSWADGSSRSHSPCGASAGLRSRGNRPKIRASCCA